MTRATVFILFICTAALAQAPGVLPDWEVRKVAAALEKHTKTMEDLLAQLKPAEWVKDGAPELYSQQWKQARQGNEQLGMQAQALSEQPEKLTLALDTFFRLDYVQALLDSLSPGVRKYQNPALADLLASAISQNSATRERLKEYVQQLATDREKEWEIANREAQRCREILSKRPPSPPSRKAAPARSKVESDPAGAASGPAAKKPVPPQP